jgi:kinetochore protein Mis13/DSN1
VKQAFEEDDAPAPKRTKTEMNPPAAKRATNGATKKAVKNGECGLWRVRAREKSLAGCGSARFVQLGCDRIGTCIADGVIAYDENDDGFQFTRRTSRRTAAKGQQVPEPIPEEVAKPAKPIPARRKKESLAAPELAPSQSTKRRRSARLSTDKEHSDADPGPIPKAAKKVAPKQQKTPAPEVEEKVKVRDAQTPQPNELHVAKKRDGAATKIMLPFADTPVITRNKEMRKASKDGHRRSSTGLRGRRASSLIDSGLSNGEFFWIYPMCDELYWHHYTWNNTCIMTRWNSGC